MAGYVCGRRRPEISGNSNIVECVDRKIDRIGLDDLTLWNHEFFVSIYRHNGVCGSVNRRSLYIYLFGEVKGPDSDVALAVLIGKPEL